jgi:hypothetical protein
MILEAIGVTSMLAAVFSDFEKRRIRRDMMLSRTPDLSEAIEREGLKTVTDWIWARVDQATGERDSPDPVNEALLRGVDKWIRSMGRFQTAEEAEDTSILERKAAIGAEIMVFDPGPDHRGMTMTGIGGWRGDKHIEIPSARLPMRVRITGEAEPGWDDPILFAYWTVELTGHQKYDIEKPDHPLHGLHSFELHARSYHFEEPRR